MERVTRFGWVRMCLGCAAAVVIAPAVVWAQDDFISKYTTLSTHDISLVRDAARSLYVDRQPQVLDHAEWESAESGARGTVRIVSESADETCIVMRHRIHERADGPEKELEIRRCRASSGEWLLSE